jgi:hypothetical protein
LFLTAGEVDSFLADFCLVAAREDLEVGLELAYFEDVVVLGLVVLRFKEDVLADGGAAEPGCLRDVCDGASAAHRALLFVDFTENGHQEGRFA